MLAVPLVNELVARLAERQQIIVVLVASTEVGQVVEVDAVLGPAFGALPTMGLEVLGASRGPLIRADVRPIVHATSTQRPSLTRR